MGKPLGSRELEQPARVGQVARADDLWSDALTALKQLAALHQGAKDQIREGGIIEQQRSQLITRKGDVAQRLCDDRGDEHRLPAEQIDLPKKARGAMTHDLMPRAIQHRRLTLEDRDERVGRVTDLIQLLAHLGRELLAALRKQLELSTRKHPSRNRHRIISVRRHLRDKRSQIGQADDAARPCRRSHSTGS